MAFFPCIRFEDQAILWFRGDNYAQKEWDDISKLEYAVECQRELTDLYELISYMTIICIRKRIPLIIENPYSTQHYLTQRWCMKPKVIDTDRRERGDVYRKPTQYWFINCEPSNNFVWEPQIVWDEYLSVHKGPHGIKRSLMTTEYANRFIREFILDEGASDET